MCISIIQASPFLPPHQPLPISHVITGQYINHFLPDWLVLLLLLFCYLTTISTLKWAQLFSVIKVIFSLISIIEINVTAQVQTISVYSSTPFILMTACPLYLSCSKHIMINSYLFGIFQLYISACCTLCIHRINRVFHNTKSDSNYINNIKLLPTLYTHRMTRIQYIFTLVVYCMYLSSYRLTLVVYCMYRPSYRFTLVVY